MSAVNTLGTTAVPQLFRITQAGNFGVSGDAPGSEGARGTEIETRSEDDKSDRVSISSAGKKLAAQPRAVAASTKRSMPWPP